MNAMRTMNAMRNGSTMDRTEVATRLYLVRHGETEYNRRGIVQGGGIDSDLNETGYAQAEALAERFSEKPVDTVYASTLRRAKQTADVLSDPHEPVTKTYLRDLEEMAWGVFEGEPPSEERNEAMSAIKDRWREGQFDHAIEGGESIRDVQARAHRATEHIVRREAGKTVLVVTHGRYLRVLLGSVLDEYDLGDMHRLDHSNTCVNHVVHTEGCFRAELLNCTAHLSTPSGAH
jgi:probable phosphoglycerate mutase